MRTSALITFLLASTACAHVIPSWLLTDSAPAMTRNLDDSTTIRSTGDKSAIIRSANDESARSFEEARGPYF
jgi:DNA recombination-dependent growth factor C